MEQLDVYTAPLTETETKAVDQFSNLLTAKSITYDTNKHNSSVLVRFLRARKMDQNKAFDMFTNYLKWRGDNGIDDINTFEYPEFLKVQQYYPHGFHKVDKQGRPIYIEILGELNIDELFKITTPERLLLYQVSVYEKMIKEVFPICSQSAQRFIQQMLTIIDMKKLSSKLLSKKVYNFLKLTTQNSQNYYPEILGQLYIVNTGFLFKALWSVAKAFLDEKTRKKVVILGTDFKKKILELVDVSNLPKFLGGECSCEPYGCIFSNAGPWNKGEKIEISEELLKKRAEFESESAEGVEGDGNKENGEINEDFNDKDEVNEKISRKVSDQMNISDEKNGIVVENGIEAKV